jgi:hypothetical protein
MLFCKKQKVIDIVLIIAGSYQQRHKFLWRCAGKMRVLKNQCKSH